MREPHEISGSSSSVLGEKDPPGHMQLPAMAIDLVPPMPKNSEDYISVDANTMPSEPISKMAVLPTAEQPMQIPKSSSDWVEVKGSFGGLYYHKVLNLF